MPVQHLLLCHRCHGRVVEVHPGAPRPPPSRVGRVVPAERSTAVVLDDRQQVVGGAPTGVCAAVCKHPGLEMEDGVICDLLVELS